MEKCMVTVSESRLRDVAAADAGDSKELPEPVLTQVQLDRVGCAPANALRGEKDLPPKRIFLGTLRYTKIYWLAWKEVEERGSATRGEDCRHRSRGEIVWVRG